MTKNVKSKKPLGLKFRTLNGDRRLIHDPQARKSVLITLFQATGLLTIREVGEKVLPDAYNIPTCLFYITRILQELRQEGLVHGRKRAQYPTSHNPQVWIFRLTPRGRVFARHLHKEEGTP